MSHGNTNHEDFLDRLNSYLARLMGKKKKRLKPNKSLIPSNLKFVIIVCIMSVILWGLTGLYYISNNSYGLIVKNGRLDNIISGMEVGITLPYPFAQVMVLDSSINKISAGKIGPGSAPFYILSQDDQQLSVSAEISYSISEPKRFFLNYFQDDINIDRQVRLLTMAIIQDYALKHSSNFLLETSNIIISNEIRRLSDVVLVNYGIKLNKLIIINLQNVDLAKDLIESSQEESSLNKQILTQAFSYEIAKKEEANRLTKNFNRLLPQYHDNQNIIVELMYYKMLNAIPAESVIATYPLLNLSLAEYVSLCESTNQTTNRIIAVSPSMPEMENNRNLNRNIDRQRVFKDR